MKNMEQYLLCRIRSEIHSFSAAAFADKESVKVTIGGGRSNPTPSCALRYHHESHPRLPVGGWPQPEVWLAVNTGTMTVAAGPG